MRRVAKIRRRLADKGGTISPIPPKPKAIKASAAAQFLQDNGVRFQVGEATQAMKGPDLADEAKALSAYVECR
jgi:hypothetical protein